MTLPQRLQAWLARIDALALRERVLVFVAALGILYLGWSQLAFAPLSAYRDQLVAEVERTRAQTEELNAQIRRLAQARSEDPNAAERARLAELREALEQARSRVREVTRSLVPPEKMAGLLEAVLNRQTDLTLVRLESLGVEPALGPAGEDGAAPPDGLPGTLFRHGLRIELRGSYLETLRYLGALEALPWQFLWESVEVEVLEYPSVRVSITVYSLSEENAWIGVSA